MTPKTLGVLAFGYNIGILGFNAGFTQSDELQAYDKEFWGWPCQATVLIFGLCYLSSGLDNANFRRRGGWIW